MVTVAKFNTWEPVGKNTIRVEGGPTKNPKKMTGTRLGAILGANKWKSPFGAWCEIARVAELPFEGNKFTEAGEAIEPKLMGWCKENVSPHIVTPNEWFKTKQKLYDHFPDDPIFGGQWDGLVLESKGGNPIAVVEAKTSSRPQDWERGVPVAYAMQGLAYAYLLGVDRVFFPVAFLNPEDYDDPSLFECTDDNTYMYELTTSTWVHNDLGIGELLSEAQTWHETHILGNISPPFNEKRDKEYLDILRKSVVSCGDLEALATQASALEDKIASLVAKMPELKAAEKELAKVKKQMKPIMVDLFTEKDETVAAYGWKVKKSTKEVIDTEQMKADNVFDKYVSIQDDYRLSKEKNNGNS